MKNLKVIDLSKFSPEVAKEIAEMEGVRVAGGYIYVDNKSAKLISKIIRGRTAKVGKEERLQDAYIIASTFNHQSFENFPTYMNDRAFLLEVAKHTPTPRVCKNYFYQYINKNLRNNKVFNFEFLTEIISRFGVGEARHVANKYNLTDILNQIIEDNEHRALISSPSGKLSKIDY